MARDGSGNYSLPLSAVVADTVILASWANTTMNDIAAALTASIAKDGQTNPTANLPMNSFKHTDVAATAARTEYLRAAEYQDGTFLRLTGVAGTATAITATGPLSLAAYANGQKFSFVAGSAAAGATTINISGIGAKNITKNGTTAIAANDWASGAIVEIEYDGTQFQLKSPSLSISGYVPATTVGIAFTSGAEILYRHSGGTIPSGWTAAATNNKAVRIANTPGADGGSVAFTTAFTSQAVAGTNANESSHTHAAGTLAGSWAQESLLGNDGTSRWISPNTSTVAVTISGSTAAGSAHTHTFTGTAINLAVQYRDFLCLVKT